MRYDGDFASLVSDDVAFAVAETDRNGRDNTASHESQDCEAGDE